MDARVNNRNSLKICMEKDKNVISKKKMGNVSSFGTPVERKTGLL